LRQFDTLRRKTPRVIVYKGKNKLDTIRDQMGAKGYAVGFEGLISYIGSQLPANEVIGKALREETQMYPEIAIRELVANALIHQDFDETGSSVLIEIYSDRIEIANPGKPMIPTERFVDEYKSRNERLADLMRRMGICEEKSSGIDKVISSTEYYQLPAPDFRVGTHHTSIVLFAHKDFAEMDSKERVRACYLHCCLRYVNNEKMTNQSLRERFRVPDNRSETISRIIADALDVGLVKLDDPENRSKRYTRYTPFWA
jgi:ATP-dependent DNA helicase RecG